VVSFLEGDPDRPLITGSVYNAQQGVSYPLPDKQVMSTWRSSSSKGGGNSNEIRMDDTKGKEQFYVHAAYDYDMLVDHDRKETIGGNSHHVIKGDQFELTQGDRHVHVKGDLNEKVDNHLSLKVGSSMQQDVGGAWELESGNEIDLKATLGVVIEGMSVTLKGPGGFVMIDSTGVTIQGTLVNINSGGSAQSAASPNPTPPKDPLEVQPGAPTQSAPPPPQPSPPRVTTFSPAAAVLKQAAHSGRPFCEH
jgi:type VI secretion system secreted protein VgrG